MKLFEQILITVITVVCTSIATYLVGKRLISGQKNAIFDEILDYLGSPEGQQSVRNLGTIFAQGISKGIGLGGSPLKGKTFGVSNAIIVPIVEKIFGKKTEGAKSEETVDSTSGKFG